MAQIWGEILIVEEEKLIKMPKAFQDYVKDYFEKREIFGKKCFYAFRTCGGIEARYGKKGVAPSHSVDLMHYKEGLPEDENLCEWIRKAVKRKLLIKLSQDWNDGCAEPFGDD